MTSFFQAVCLLVHLTVCIASILGLLQNPNMSLRINIAAVYLNHFSRSHASFTKSQEVAGIITVYDWSFLGAFHSHENISTTEN